MEQFSVLNNLPLLAHERFSAARELEALLRKCVKGEVRFDLGSRALYASDSSNYRQLPVGVIFPRDAEDVASALAACRSVGAAVLPRGAGTSLAGQCANVAVVFDYSRHMQGLAGIDADARVATVEPGIILDTLRDATELHHLTYAPDPATHSRCTLGGMIGNNSCGVHGLLGGKVSDNVESLDLVLYDGTRMTVGRTSADELQAIIAAGGRRGEIYAGLKQLRDRYADLIRQRFPKIPRRVSGYNLDELLDENGFHVARALVGSEGTCANIVGARLNLSVSPPCRVLVALGFEDVFVAADAVPQILEFKPIGLEGMDQMLLDFMRRKQLAVENVSLLPPGGGFLLVEFGGWSDEEAQAKARELADAARGWKNPPASRIYSTDEAKRVWSVRESALGATVFVPGEPDGWEGWEDAGIPPEHLGAYLRKLTALMKEFGYRTPMYGHFGQGCVHMRINFDFGSEAGIKKFREFLERAADLVLGFGGSLSGEHGDGQARAALLPKMFGPELCDAFREFKRIWDPENKMNPGKLVDAVRVYDPVENLRHGAHEMRELETHFAFAADGGSFARATERCVGVAACRKTSGGVMCPSFRATNEEQHSTRGRARLLWEIFSGALQEEGFQSGAAREALELCLSCKACKSECPVQVDVAKWKAEFLAQHYKGRLHPLHHYVFGFADKLARWGALLPQLTNGVTRFALTGAVVKKIVGVAAERKMPQLAAKSFRADVKQSGSGKERVVLWADTWNNYYHPPTLKAAHEVLEAAGFDVVVPQKHLCCGRPLYDFGLLEQAKKYLLRVLDSMRKEIDAGTPFIFLEPSCASVFTDEMPEMLPQDERAKKMSKQIWLLADWLAAKAPEWSAERLKGRQVLLHGHCHHKASFGGPKSELALLKRSGADARMIEAGCCGMAGPFGFEADKYELSKSIAETALLPAVRGADAETLLVADGFSCREQIAQLSNRKALHIAEVLALRDE